MDTGQQSVSENTYSSIYLLDLMHLSRNNIHVLANSLITYVFSVFAWLKYI